MAISVTCSAGCSPQSDQFTGSELDPKWSILNPSAANPPTVSEGAAAQTVAGFATGDAVLAHDGCLNFFAGPTDKTFSASLTPAELAGLAVVIDLRMRGQLAAHQIAHQMRRMARRHEVVDRRRQQPHLIHVPRPKGLAHARR